MRLRALCALLAATGPGLVGCDAAQAGKDLVKGAQAGFDTSFSREFLASCVTSAQGAGASAALARTYCGCMLDKVSVWTFQEKIAIDPRSEKFRQAAIACQLK